MDGHAFDGMVRAFGRRSGRRRALLVAAGLAGLAVVAGPEAPPAAADIAPSCFGIRGRCRRHYQCCSLVCESGRCLGSALGGRCIGSAGCTVGYCHISSGYRGYCRCVTRNRRCTDNKECCSGVCSMIGRCGCSSVGQACEMSMHCCGTAICVDGWCVAAP